MLSSRPHHGPAKTPPVMVRRIVHLRWRLRLGPVQIAGRLGVPAATVRAVLTRCRINHQRGRSPTIATDPAAPSGFSHPSPD